MMEQGPVHGNTHTLRWALSWEQHLDFEQVELGESRHRAVHGRVTTEAQTLPSIYGFKCFIFSVLAFYWSFLEEYLIICLILMFARWVRWMYCYSSNSVYGFTVSLVRLLSCFLQFWSPFATLHSSCVCCMVFHRWQWCCFAWQLHFGQVLVTLKVSIC